MGPFFDRLLQKLMSPMLRLIGEHNRPSIAPGDEPALLARATHFTRSSRRPFAVIAYPSGRC